MGCVICSEREGEKERGAGGAPRWPKRPPRRAALAGEVAGEGAGDISPSEGLRV